MTSRGTVTVAAAAPATVRDVTKALPRERLLTNRVRPRAEDDPALLGTLEYGRGVTRRRHCLMVNRNGRRLTSASSIETTNE